MDLNKVQIIGRITNDLVPKKTPTGKEVLSFSVATNSEWRDNDNVKHKDVEYHNIVVWNKLCEVMARYCGKGSKVYLEGKLKTRTWEKLDGDKRYRTEIIVSNMIMLDAKKPDSEASYPAPADKVKSDSEEEINIEDIPF